ncbi:hypothetical protein POUND7_004164 [Theobroma cacao]
MQRLCSKLRSLALRSTQTLPSLSASRRFLHHSSPPIPLISTKWSFNSLLNNNAASPSLAVNSFRYSPLPLSVVQVRHVSSRERAKRRKPMTPRTSKIKKIKMKSYSSYKSRFRVMSDGSIRRWREGKNHNAHLKGYSEEFPYHFRVVTWALWHNCGVNYSVTDILVSYFGCVFWRNDAVMCVHARMYISFDMLSCLLSKKSRRRLRQPAIVPAAYAKVLVLLELLSQPILKIGIPAQRDQTTEALNLG